MTTLANTHHLVPAPSINERVAAGELEAPEDYNTYPAPGLYMAVAKRLASDLFSTGDGVPTIRYWRGQWWRYTGRHWQSVHEDDIRKPVWDRLNEVTYLKDDKGEKAHKPWLPSLAKVTNVLEPLRLMHLLSTEVEAPAWTGNGRAPGDQLVSMDNGLFDITTGTLHPHTPHWFTTWSVPFGYDRQAQSLHWENYLAEVFEHDPAARDLLQEYMGYLLSGKTDLHKSLLIVGVPRAGKGVLGGVLTDMMGGQGNVGAPTLTSLGDKFGLKQLIGKPLALIGDARNAPGGNNKAVETLLGIIGGDVVTAQCKGKDDWIGRLNARFVIMSNEMPRFVDASGAISTRFVAFQLVKSFKGREDRQLPTRLREEMPGIFNWALAGLARLQANVGVFTEPRTQLEMIETMQEVAAPVVAFLKEEFTITHSEEDMATRTEVYERYRTWCVDNGYKPMNAKGLDIAVTAAAIEGVRPINKRNPPGAQQGRARVITGIKKKSNSLLN